MVPPILNGQLRLFPFLFIMGVSVFFAVGGGTAPEASGKMRRCLFLPDGAH